MKLTFPLILHSVIPFAIAGTAQFCTVLEGPSFWSGRSFGLDVTVHDENSTVLIFGAADFALEFEGSVNFDMKIAVDDGTYPICSHSTEDYRKQQFCHSKDNFGLFDQESVLGKRIFWPVTAARLSPGESQNYTAPSTGVYCVLVHQEHAETVDLDGVDVHVSHPYGDFDFTFLLSSKLLLAFELLFTIHYFVIPHAFPNTPREHRYGFRKLLSLTVQGQLAVWLIQKLPTQYVWQNVLHLARPVYPVLQLSPWILCDHAISFGLVSVMFAVWNGLLCKYITPGVYCPKGNLRGKAREFVSRRSYGAILTTIVVSSLGRILVHHIVESAPLTALMMDIDASLVALILSTLDHSKRDLQYFDAVHCTNCSRPKKEGDPRGYHVTSRVEQHSKDIYIAQLKANPSRFAIEVTPWPPIILLLVVSAVYLLMDLASALGYHLGLPYVNQYRLSKMAYHHFIGLNTLLNWIYCGFLIIYDLFPSINIIVNDAA